MAGQEGNDPSVWSGYATPICALSSKDERSLTLVYPYGLHRPRNTKMRCRICLNQVLAANSGTLFDKYWCNRDCASCGKAIRLLITLPPPLRLWLPGSAYCQAAANRLASGRQAAPVHHYAEQLMRSPLYAYASA